ncbi:MAG TPA: hypothetical protein HA252_05205 [Candidatus Diapherotrites archaeon]|uniref:Uncharacterized protein n=1 Tax=Candidatus Iainarchaeum sp. TaxID=3101447 RepID=A0A7J4JGF3_9ARCH|nr:hypothetical protein [Candidatus Diapherotrites archaeon]HIH16778.1 hypothetical protein [Candidatus Diapherotrites archaeon]
MKAFSVVAVLSLLLLLGCTAQKAAPPAQPVVQTPSAEMPSAVTPPEAPVVEAMEADVQAVDDSLKEVDALLADLDSAEFDDTGINADTFK